MSDQSNVVIETKIKELENVRRLVTNNINLINDSEFKGAYAGPVAEILGWLEGFKTSVNNQIEGFKAALPKVEEAKAETVEAK